MKNILFLCTGNSARSLIAEGILRHLGGDRYMAYSAGSQPTGHPNPAALAVLSDNGIDISFARSKSWDEFSTAEAAEIHIVITVCSNAANETCPIWPGHPTTAHWGVDDPAAITAPADAVTIAFSKTFEQMHRRITALLNLTVTEDIAELQADLDAIGRLED